MLGDSTVLANHKIGKIVFTGPQTYMVDLRKIVHQVNQYLQDFLWYPMVNLSMFTMYKSWMMSGPNARPNLVVTGSATVNKAIIFMQYALRKQTL